MVKKSNRKSLMTPMERVTLTLAHQEADKVPLFLMLSLYGAKEMGVTVQSYFSKAENVIKMQEYMQKKYRVDCFDAFFYAGIEIEAMGGEINFIDEGPPNTGEPIFKKAEDILSFECPKVADSLALKKVLQVIESLKKKYKNTIPIVGVAVSPFSLPVMQIGFEKYLDLIHEKPFFFKHLMRKNEAFCVEWANAQIAAGASAICYFDPVSSPTIISPDLYKKTGFEIAKRVVAKIKAPVVMHMASGRVLPILDYVVKTGTAIMGISSMEDAQEIKERIKGQLTVIGNLNGIEMCRWNKETTEFKVKELIKKAAFGGGLIIADNHGEIPYQVKEETLLSIAETVENFGLYPLNFND